MAVANERVVNGVKTRILHNKDYVEVAERLRIVHELKKELEVIESQPVQFGDRCIWRVVIKVDGKQYIGNAEAKMNARKDSPDGTNPFECAETSALGRALAFAGFGTVESIASYDEIARSQPFVAVIEQAQGRVVESNAPKQIESPAYREVYLAGGKKHLWSNQAGFYAFASAVLGMAVSADNVRLLDSEQIEILTHAVAADNGTVAAK
jgi:hypothetical protein